MSQDAAADLPELDDPPADPLALVRRWVAQATRRGVPDPLAASLATVGPDGAPGVRHIAVKELTEDGVVFATSLESPKGQDMQARPQVALAMYWPQTMQQVRILGEVTVLDEATSDRLFAELPRAMQASAVTARQSEPLDARPGLHQAARELAHSQRPIPRPAAWRGWLVTPSAIQLWAASEDQVHRRVAYTRSAGSWTARLLQP